MAWQDRWYMHCGLCGNMLVQHSFANLSVGWKSNRASFITPWTLFSASITSQGLLYEAKQQQVWNKTLFITLKNSVAPQNESKKSPYTQEEQQHQEHSQQPRLQQQARHCNFEALDPKEKPDCSASFCHPAWAKSHVIVTLQRLVEPLAKWAGFLGTHWWTRCTFQSFCSAIWKLSLRWVLTRCNASFTIPTLDWSGWCRGWTVNVTCISGE